MPLKKQALIHTPAIDEPAAPAPRLESARAHPKILKRPAHFAASPPLALPSTAVMVTVAAMPTAPAAKSWSEDGRFAITLLAIIIVMNVVVGYWLSNVKPQRTLTSNPTSVAATPVIAPVVMHPGPLGLSSSHEKQVYVLDDLATSPTATP